jgi:hypothetical protein
MNCLEFQRVLNADPRHIPAPARQHAENCPDCARRMVKQINFDASLAHALQIPAPEGMEDRILLATRFSEKRRMTLYAVAASVLIAVTVTLGPAIFNSPSELEMAIEHVLAEPEHLAETVDVSPATLNNLLAHVGARSDNALDVTYANACDLPNGKGGHIVLNTAHGRVTLMLMPNGKSGVVKRKEMKGVIAEMYAAQHGNYSLIADSDVALVAAKQMLASHLRWV